MLGVEVGVKAAELACPLIINYKLPVTLLPAVRRVECTHSVEGSRYQNIRVEASNLCTWRLLQFSLI